MEPEPKPTFWNVDATDFIPSDLPIFLPLSQAPPKPKSPKSKKKRSHKPRPGHKEEKKFNPRCKDCTVLSVLGSPGSGKSSVASALSGHTSGTTIPQCRILQCDSKSRRYSILDSTGPIQSQVLSIAHSDHFLVVFSVQEQGQEDYFKELASVLRNYANGRVVIALSHMEEISWDCNDYNEAAQRIRHVFDGQGVRETIS